MKKEIFDVINRKNNDSNVFDIVIRNGTVVDGTGNPAYKADIAIKGTQIVEVGKFEEYNTLCSIDASGKIVCPGFIDAHSHTDATIMANPNAESTIRQGITTEIVGNCGNSFAPITNCSQKASLGFGRFSEVEYFKCSFGNFIDAVCKMATSNNLAYFVGHNTIRSAVGVNGTHVTDEEMKLMGGLVEEAMEMGAFGLSTGLEFEPGRNASKEEIIGLTKILKKYDGFYASHIRNRDSKVQEAIEEFIEIVQYCEVRGQVSHFNIRYNTGAPENAWVNAVDTIISANNKGMDIFADMTPLEYGIGQMTAILPPWIRNEGPKKAAQLMRDPLIRKRVQKDCDRYWRFIHRGEWERVSMQSNPAFPEINGMSFPEIAKLWQKDPWDCYFDILSEAGTEMDGIVIVANLFKEEHLRECIRHPLFMLVVDGFSTKINGRLAAETYCPLHYMGMTHFLTYHVREKNTLSLEQAINKMTGMPARRFGIKNRGFIQKDYIADVVVFDYNNLDDKSTVKNPLAYVQGVEYVFVNGVPVVYESEHTGARPGVNILRN